jgi:hypothetical protein
MQSAHSVLPTECVPGPHAVHLNTQETRRMKRVAVVAFVMAHDLRTHVRTHDIEMHRGKDPTHHKRPQTESASEYTSYTPPSRQTLPDALRPPGRQCHLVPTPRLCGTPTPYCSVALAAPACRQRAGADLGSRLSAHPSQPPHPRPLAGTAGHVHRRARRSHLPPALSSIFRTTTSYDHLNPLRRPLTLSL